MITNERLVFRFSDVEVHEHELKVTRGGQALNLEPKAFRALVHLIRNAGHLVTKRELIDAVWGETVVTENSLTRVVALLRRVLEDDPREPHFIETVSTAGYRFICPVETEGSTAASSQVADEAPTADVTQEMQNASTTVLTETMARSWLRNGRWSWVVGAAVLVVAAIAVGWWQWWSTPAAPYVTSIEAITHDGIYKGWPVTDGTRVYFTEQAKLAQVSAAGGEASIIATPFDWNWACDITPDKSNLLVAEVHWNGPSPLWMLSMPEGAPRRVGNLSADSAILTPDGSQIVFIRGAEVWIANADGSQARKILTATGIAFGPRVSPNGERIRFSVSEQRFIPNAGFEDEPTGMLWEANRDGSGAHRLLSGWQESQNQIAGSWSPDGRYHVFTVGTRRSQDLWLLPERRGWFSHRQVPVQLTRGPLAFSGPVFSPAGRTVFAMGAEQHGELTRLDPTTHLSAPYLFGISATEEAFSPDGQWVTYITWPDFILWRSRTDGSERMQLTSPRGFAELPRWSPDGKRIVFDWSDGGKPWKLAVISWDAGTPEQVIPESEDSHEQMDPTWSPDGEQIIFARDVNEGPAVRMELMQVDLRTHKVAPVPGSEGLYSPRWSPDGRYLAAFSLDARSIRLFDFQKQVWTTWFTAEEGHVAWNFWSHDSRALHFEAGKTNHTAFWRFSLGSQAPTKIADLPVEDLAPTLAPDGSVVYTRDLSTYEIYALHLSEK